MSLFTPRKRLSRSRAAARRGRRRRRLAALAVLAFVLVGGAYAFANVLGPGGALSQRDGGGGVGGRAAAGPAGPGRSSDREAGPPAGQGAAVLAPDGDGRREPPQPPPVPEAAKETPAGAAYWAVAPELPGMGPENVEAVYKSSLNPSWASVHVAPEGEGKFFAVFVRKEGGVWKAKKSMRADEPDYPRNDVAAMGEVPEDLVDYLYPENAFAAKAPEPEQEKVKVGDLPEAGPAEFPPPEPVGDGVPDAERGRVEGLLKEARTEAEGYGGTAGLYVRELGAEGGFGYGIRPDETFFSASVIKVPVMVAVYRKVDEGELAFTDRVEIKDEDWAAGAGWLQWKEAGTKQTVGDLLLLMMTESDNVATNALVRTVGGADHVNGVARSLGAEDTVLYQKVSSERAAVPELDNRTTPRDMATMMQKIAEDEAASPKSCGYMVDLMRLNELDWWLDAGLPGGLPVAANKAGWLYEVYDEAGIVEKDGRFYAVAIMTKYGDESVDGGSALIENLSRTVWEGQREDPEKDQPEGRSQPETKNGGEQGS